jgi:mRNA interferase MazF
VNLLRGELYWAEIPDLGRKLFLIVSWNAVNRGLRQPVVARVTAQERERALPTHVELNPGEGGVRERSWILCHELATLRESSFVERLGELPLSRVLEVDTALRRALDLGH